MPWQKGVNLRRVERKENQGDEALHQITTALRQTLRDDVTQETQQQQQQRPWVKPSPDQTASSVHGKEVHVATQKQTQKEVSRGFN